MSRLKLKDFTKHFTRHSWNMALPNSALTPFRTPIGGALPWMMLCIE
jgi:hypothetical protein